MTYQTGNALGSSDPRDLYDNASNLDAAANGGADLWTDRMGEERKSWRGMEREFESAQAERARGYEVAEADRDVRFNSVIASSGYSGTGAGGAVEDYSAGIELTEYNQIIRDPSGGEFWRLSGSTPLPYTTIGSGLPEGGAMVGLGDAVLRQDLAGNPSSGLGALKVNAAVFYADSLASLQAIPTAALLDGQRAELVNGVGYHWDAGTGDWELIGAQRINNRGSTDTDPMVDLANFPDAPRRASVIHHYNDREMCVWDNVGEENLFLLLRNANNSTRRDDKPADFYGTADFLRCQNRYPYGGDYQTFTVFELDYNGDMVWPNQGDFNAGVKLVNKQVTHNFKYSFTLETKTSNTRLLEITESEGNPAFQFRTPSGTLARIDSGAGMTSGMYINAAAGSLDLVATNGVVRLEAQLLRED